MFATSINLNEDVRRQVVTLLNSRLADAIDLSLQAKQAHWNVKGPHFIALHELFDSIHSLVDEQVDEIAERITALGGVAEGALQAVGPRTGLPTYPLEISNGLDHVRALSRSLAAFTAASRKDIDRTDELGDAVTADVLTGVSREMDKQLWFLEAHLQSDR